MKQPNPKFLRWLKRVQRLMVGRYGQNDSLNRFLSGVALILLIVSLFVRTGWLILAAILLMVLVYWRLFSHQIYRQVALNRGFERVWRPLTRPFSRLHYWAQQHRRYRFFHCANCHQRIRIPRHHGHVRITCPTCGHQFDART